MLGILTGMKITFQHFFGRKVTRLYPYEKRELPPRMRGLIHYLRDEHGQYKCEGCLLCEKICPPQAITVTYRPRETRRDRPLSLPRAIWGNFRRSTKSLLSHQGRPELAVGQRQPAAGEAAVDRDKIDALVSGESAGLAAALGEIQAAVGYLPRHAVEQLTGQSGVDASNVYALATTAGFQGEPNGHERIAACQCPVCRSAGGREIAAAVAAEMTAAGCDPSAPWRAGTPATTGTTHRSSRCLGDVRQAPVLVVGGHIHGAVTPDNARRIVREYLAAGGSAR